MNFSDGSVLKVTWDHPIFALEGVKAVIPEFSREKDILNLTRLEVGDLVYGFNPVFNFTFLKRLVSINCEVGTFKTYNLLNITPYNNYYADNVLVHNKQGSG